MIFFSFLQAVLLIMSVKDLRVQFQREYALILQKNPLNYLCFDCGHNSWRWCLCGWTPLLYCDQEPRCECCSLVRLARASSRCTQKIGRQPIHVAAEYGRWEVLHNMIREQQCDPFALDNRGRAPIHVAGIHRCVLHSDTNTLLVQLWMARSWS